MSADNQSTEYILGQVTSLVQQLEGQVERSGKMLGNQEATVKEHGIAIKELRAMQKVCPFRTEQPDKFVKKNALFYLLSGIVLAVVVMVKFYGGN